MITLNDVKVAALLLRDLERRQNADGGGDLILPLTPDNLALVERADAACHGLTVVGWRESAEYEAPAASTRGNQIVTNNVLITNYIRAQLESFTATASNLSLEIDFPKEQI